MKTVSMLVVDGINNGINLESVPVLDAIGRERDTETGSIGIILNGTSDTLGSGKKYIMFSDFPVGFLVLGGLLHSQSTGYLLSNTQFLTVVFFFFPLPFLFPFSFSLFSHFLLCSFSRSLKCHTFQEHLNILACYKIKYFSFYLYVASQRKGR